MNKAKYRYLINFKHKHHGPRVFSLVTGYVPSGLRMSEIRKYIQGQAEDKKIVGMTKLEQKHYYPEMKQVGSLDVTDQELFEAQEDLMEDNALSKLAEESNSPSKLGLNENTGSDELES